MNDELQAIKTHWGTGKKDRNEDDAREAADRYVKAHPDEFKELATMSHDDCVKAIDVFRAAKMEESVWRVQTWLFHRFEPQHIGGQAQALVRKV